MPFQARPPCAPALVGGLRAAHLEWAAVLLILCAALVPRARDLAGPFDRGLEGFQGAFFAICAVNYERLGVGAVSGYPVANLDLPRDPAGEIARDPGGWVAYANHPPTTPLLAWLALKALGPEGWSEAWRDGRAPADIEAPIRLPFLALHAAGLLAFWWALRQTSGAARSLIALALLAVTPVSVLYATLVNVENPSLVFALLSCGFGARWLRGGRSRDLALAASSLAAGCAVTYAPLFFLPPLVLWGWRAGARRALALLSAGAIAGLLPLGLHALASSRALARIGRPSAPVLERARELLQPLLDGSLPFAGWLARQVEHAGSRIGWPLLAAALIGLLLPASRRVARSLDRWLSARELPGEARGPDLAVPLLAGGLLYLLAFYRHTWDAQYVFLMFLAPGVCALAARALDALTGPLLALRAGIAPQVVLVSSLGLPCIARFNALRHELRAPGDSPAASLYTPPELPLPDAIGAAIAGVCPPGAIGLHPEVLGLNHAASFYAWRSLVPAPIPDEQLRRMAAASGLADAPILLLLPDDPPESARAGCEELRRELVGEAAPSSLGSGWSAWRLGG